MRIYNSKVLIIGAQGVGVYVVYYWAGFSINQLGLVNKDCVEEGKIHSQTT